MVYRTAGRLKSEFVIAPGADPSAIKLRFTGSDGLAVLPMETCASGPQVGNCATNTWTSFK